MLLWRCQSHLSWSILYPIMEPDINLSKFNLESISLASLDVPSLLIGAIAMALVGVMVYLAARSGGRSKMDGYRLQIDNHLENLSIADAKIRELEEKFQTSQQDVVRAQTEKESFERQIRENRADLDKMEKKFEVQFENLAHKIFDEKTTVFKKQSQENLSIILSPLKDKLNDFEKKVNDSFGKQANEQFALKEQIKLIVDVNEKMTLQAEGLTNALKGDSKVQGDWGEVMLEKILEDVGLRKGDDYVLQGTGLDMTDQETGKRQKPDVVVNLPDSKHVIIDSKVSLTAYERYFNETEDDVARATHLKNHLNAIKERVKELEKRRYQDTDKLGTPDFVLMFIPIESAYMLALQQDRELHQFAWNKGVAIVCPSTLFSSLSTIASLWRLVRQNQNAEEIAKKGGDLYNKIAGFVEDMQLIGRNLKTLEGNYDGAMKKLSTGKGNILTRTENLKELGAKATKSLPAQMLTDDNSDEEAA